MSLQSKILIGCVAVFFVLCVVALFVTMGVVEEEQASIQLPIPKNVIIMIGDGFGPGKKKMESHHAFSNFIVYFLIIKQPQIRIY